MYDLRDNKRLSGTAPMKYTLTTPCAKCPFRTDIPAYLTKARVQELERALVGQQQTFTCHETTVPDDGDEDGVAMMDGPRAQHCAGALILLEKIGKPNQMMRISERLGMYDYSKLNMHAPVFKTFKAMRAAQP